MSPVGRTDTTPAAYDTKATMASELAALSCPHAHFNMAVGTVTALPNGRFLGTYVSAVIDVWDGSTWRVGRPDILTGLHGVSCPTATWRVAVGGARQKPLGVYTPEVSVFSGDLEHFPAEILPAGG